MRILVCGSRDYGNGPALRAIVGGACLPGKRVSDGGTPVTIISGGAKGADALAAEFAKSRQPCIHEEYPADWDRYGKRAGYVRNQQMLDEGKPDLVIAFYSGTERSKGTAMMVDIARKAGVECWEIFS